MTDTLIPKICGDRYRPIRLNGPTSTERLDCRGAVGTGMTCGIDSYYTLKTHPVTDLAYFDCGHIFHLIGVLPEDVPPTEYYAKARAIADARAARAVKIADRAGLGFVYVFSNLDEDFYRGGIIYRTMYANLSCVLALQKRFGTFISSSSGHGKDIQTELFAPTQNYENLICATCKTETLDYCSSDSVGRFEKLKLLADEPLCQTDLDVCFNFTGENCGACYGCLKTMVMLDLLGKLDRFGQVFDLETYFRNRAQNIGILADGVARVSSVRTTWLDLVAYARRHPGELSDMILRRNESIFPNG